MLIAPSRIAGRNAWLCQCFFLSLLLVVLLPVCSAPLRAALPPLIPRALLFDAPEFGAPALSPDGRQLAYLAPDQLGVQQLRLRTLAGTDDVPLTAITHGRIHEFHWAPSGVFLYYLLDQHGDERWRLYAVEVATHHGTAVSAVGETVYDLRVRPELPNDVLARVRRADGVCFCRYHLRVDGPPQVSAVTPAPAGISAWDATSALTMGVCLRRIRGGGQSLVVFTPSGDAQPPAARVLYHWGTEDQGSLLGLTDHDNSLLLLSNHEANALRLWRINLATGASQVVAEDAQYDVGPVLSNGTRVLAVGVEKEKLSWTVCDPSVADDFAALAKVDSGVFIIASRDAKDAHWIAGYSSDSAPRCYYLYDRATKKCTRLFSSNQQLAECTLAKKAPVTFTARDGLPIHGYVTTPVGVPAKGLPLVLLVHGGPWDRCHWPFDAESQWLANRGYAVLQLNYRGSTGYGKAFLNAGNHEWGGKMQDDLSDGVNWAIAQGLADAKHIAIMGTSYGGYAALTGLAFTPTRYVAGVDLSGPSDLYALRQLRGDISTPFGTPENVAIGNPATEAPFLKGRSPSTFLDRIVAPMLIGQGVNDPRVAAPVTEQLVMALHAAKKSVQYVVYPDEGHGLARPENRQQFYALVEAFLATYLGGRCEPAGTLSGASGVVR